jgi:uncharacterized protein YdeI (YjbR/CyaY-like superfamily)
VTLLDPTDEADWRAWLTENATTRREVWLILRRGTLTYTQAVEQALCFGWIDGLHRKHDTTATTLRFTPRNPTSTWSPLNRTRAEHMIATAQMTPTGQAAIDHATSTGTWTRADTIPADLQALLDTTPPAATHFAAFPPSSQRLILEWIATAKRPETRTRRLTETATLAARNLRAHHSRTARRTRDG